MDLFILSSSLVFSLVPIRSLCVGGDAIQESAEMGAKGDTASTAEHCHGTNYSGEETPPTAGTRCGRRCRGETRHPPPSTITVRRRDSPWEELQRASEQVTPFAAGTPHGRSWSGLATPTALSRARCWGCAERHRCRCHQPPPPVPVPSHAPMTEAWRKAIGAPVQHRRTSVLPLSAAPPTTDC